MPASLIGEDSYVTVKLGKQSAGAVTWDSGGAYAISVKAKKFTIEDTVETTNTKGLGDARKQFRVHSGQSKFDLELLTAFSGYQFIDSGGTRIGDPIQVLVLEYSGLSSPRPWTGVITSWSSDISEGNEILEKITFMGDIDATYS